MTTSIPDNHAPETEPPPHHPTDNGNGGTGTEGTGVSPSTGASAGLAGAIFFVVVVILVVVLRKRMRHRKKRRGHKDSDMESQGGPVSDSDGESGEEVEEMDTLMRQKSNMSEDSFRFPMWKQVDETIKALVGESLIDTKKLTLGSVLGKGTVVCW